MPDLQIVAVSVRLPCLCDATEYLCLFICSAGYKGLTKHRNTCYASAGCIINTNAKVLPPVVAPVL